MKAEMKWMRTVEKRALELLELRAHPRGEKEDARIAELEADEMVRFALLDAQANVLCPAAKLWNTGHGATVMREAVSLMGGYGITEDCPGFLGKKWMDAQLEATYEGPEAVQRRQLSVTMTSPLFLAQMKSWVRELRHVAARPPRHRRLRARLGVRALALDLPPPRGRHRRRRRASSTSRRARA